MSSQTPVVTPFVGPNDPKLGPAAALVAVEPDLTGLVKRAGLPKSPWRSILACRVHVKDPKNGGPCAAGPVLGAPQAVAVLEFLAAWGVRRVIFSGWAGSISKDLPAGSVVVPEFGICDEGSSPNYGVAMGGISRPSMDARNDLCRALTSAGIKCAGGGVWSTDALFRETPEKIERFTGQGAVTVDMEASALFSAAAFLGIECAAVLVVSDELFTLKWRAGFLDEAFRNARRAVTEALCPLIFPEKTQKSGWMSFGR